MAIRNYNPQIRPMGGVAGMRVAQNLRNQGSLQRLGIRQGERSEQAQKYAGNALSGDPSAMDNVAALDPGMASQLQQVMANASAPQRERLAQMAEQTTKRGMSVMGSQGMQQAEAYRQYIEMESASGRNMGDYPPTFDARARNMVEEDVRQGMTVKQWGEQIAPPAAAKPTSLQLNASALHPEGSPEWRAAVEAGMKGGPLVQNTITGEKETAREREYGKTTGDADAKTYIRMQAAGRDSLTQDANLERLDQLLDQTETGLGAEFIVNARKLGERLGLQTAGIGSGVGPAEASLALTNEMALEMRSKMPGPLSDNDVNFLKSMSPGLGQSRPGRKLLIRVRKKVNKRIREIAERARAYSKAHNGMYDDGFLAELAQWASENPLFTEGDMNAREKARLPHPADEGEKIGYASGTYYIAPDGTGPWITP